jgi:hypothetical protein
MGPLSAGAQAARLAGLRYRLRRRMVARIHERILMIGDAYKVQRRYK